MRILITGGAGYIGNELVYKLVSNPEIEKIIVYDNLSRKNYNLFLDAKYPSDKIKFVFGELLDTYKLKKILQESDIVFHLAARVTTPFANDDPHLFEQVNHWGTAELVYAIEQTKTIKKFIFTSSTSIYGESDNIIDINTLPNPRTFYGTSKLRGESHIERLFSKMPSYIIRSANVYGYSPSLRFDAVINRFMFEANFNNRISISGKGEQIRAFIHIDKLVDILYNICFTDFPSGIYNAVDINLSINQIAETLKDVFPGLEMIFINQHLNINKIQVLPDTRIQNIATYPQKTFKDELIDFKNKFSF
ncbi:MAG: NAD-dependent epimerase/dehydratase family protein [Bacteroidales bacterium]|nr:NAD-dependent epimerase/dehydratase family protein [Bacteroidales bacterium]